MNQTGFQPVICGRKLCISDLHQGPRWRLLVDFPLHTGRNGRRYVRNVCAACADQQKRTYRRKEHARRRTLAPRSRGPLVTPAEPFIAAAEAWMAAFIAREKARPFRYLGADPPERQAVRQLAERSRMARDTLVLLLGGEYRFIDLDRADKLALAVQVPLNVLSEDFRPLRDWTEAA